MQQKLTEISELLNDVYCLIDCTKDSCELKEYVTQAINLTYAGKIIDEILEKLDSLDRH